MRIQFTKRARVNSLIVTKLNRKMRREKIVKFYCYLIMYPHAPELVDCFSNVKVIFLPVNTIFKLQPLDAGIIKTSKSTTGDSFLSILYQESGRVQVILHQLFVNL